MVDLALVDALERIVVAGVAMTNAALHQARPQLDLTFPQWRVLVVLGDAPDGLSVREISRSIGTTLPATGRQLRRLEHRGLITLGVDERDRRATRCRMTEAGNAARGSIIADRRARLTAALRVYGRDARLTADLERLAGLLERSPITIPSAGPEDPITSPHQEVHHATTT